MWPVLLTTSAVAVATASAVPLTYLGVLTLLSGRIKRTARTPSSLVFAVVVPAHNEAAQITETVKSLLQVDYPAAQRRVVVVADNCTDGTAQLAEAAGAEVLRRTHATERGKGFALNFAFEILLAESTRPVDAVAVVDADSSVSRNFLSALAERLDDNEIAVQAHYGVRNPMASWRTRLMAVALAMFHRVRGLGRERLGLSSGLRGNGMCFSRACLTRFPHHAHGLVEDVEYGIALGMGGARIAYADEAHVLGDMVSSAKASESQRDRWEGGRDALRRAQLGPLVRAAYQKRSLLLLDLAVDLAVPPLSRLVLLLVLAWGVELARLALVGGLAPSTYLLAMGVASLVIYLVRGVALSELGIHAVTALLFAPGYLVWKIALKLLPKPKAEGWVRTEREGAPPKK